MQFSTKTFGKAAKRELKAAYPMAYRFERIVICGVRNFKIRDTSGAMIGHVTEGSQSKDGFSLDLAIFHPMPR